MRRIKDIEWKVTITVEQKPTHNVRNIKLKNDWSIFNVSLIFKEKRNKLELKAKELSQMLSKLTQLRSLRRKNLEAKGHFFPEEGDAFYEQVKELNEKKSTGEEEKEQEEEQEVGLIIDPKDKWNSYDVDEKAYRFWTCQTVDSLLKVRRMWDQYIIDQDGDKVPPTFVSPSAPANYIWASYLY